MSDLAKDDELIEQEVYDLADACLRGDMSPAQAERLRKLVCDDARACRHYVRFMYDSCGLRTLARDRAAAQRGLGAPETATMPGGLPLGDAAADAAAGAPPSTSTTFGFLGDLARWSQNLPGMSMFVWPIAGLIGLVAGSLAIVAIVAVLGRSNRPTAQLVAATNCRWTNGTAAISVGSQLRPGQKIDLAAGEAQIAFARGAVVTVRGPSVLEIESDACARLLVGNVSAKAETERSHGFTLRLPTASVVDLGTEFHVQAAADGHSRLDVTAGEVEIHGGPTWRTRRLTAGQAAQFEPGERGVFAMIEGGDNTPAWRFPTIEPPSDKDYADASQHHAKISVVEGQLDGQYSGPVEKLLDGRGQPNSDSPFESAVLKAGLAECKILVDLGKTVLVQKVNTYSWHQRTQKLPHLTVLAPQRYTLYGFAGDSPPPVDGDPTEHGWTRICRVDTDEFFSVPPIINRPPQQAVSISGAGGQVGRYRFLLWRVLRSKGPNVLPTGYANTSTMFGEFDVYAEERD